jgi:hypothetical protein
MPKFRLEKATSVLSVRRVGTHGENCGLDHVGWGCVRSVALQQPALIFDIQQYEPGASSSSGFEVLTRH